jgi:hypothetical protein
MFFPNKQIQEQNLRLFFIYVHINMKSDMQLVWHSKIFHSLCTRITGVSVETSLNRIKTAYIPYILESDPHPFYCFRVLKYQMRIIIACGLDLQSRARFWKNDKGRCTCRKNNTIIYYFIYYNLLFIRFAVITHN